MASREYWTGKEVVCSYLLPEDFNADLRLAGRLQRVAVGSSTQKLPKRDSSDIRRIFNDHPDSKLREKQLGYVNCAKHGALVVAQDVVAEKIVGYAAIKKDISGNRLQKAAKVLLHPQKVCATIENLAILPGNRNPEVMMQLLIGALSSFDGRRTPVTYIFEEDKLSAEFYGGLGFALDPPEQTGTVINFFGDEKPPVTQFRLTAPSVAQLRSTIAERMVA